MVLKQDANQTFKRTAVGAMNHYGPVLLAILADIA